MDELISIQESYDFDIGVLQLSVSFLFFKASLTIYQEFKTNLNLAFFFGETFWI